MTSILVTSSKEGDESGNFDTIYSIDSLLSEQTVQSKVEIYNRISELDIDEPNRLPYPIFWVRFAAPMADNIVESILLYKSLEKEFSRVDGEISKVVCHSSVSDSHSAVLEDISKKFSASYIRQDCKESRISFIKNMILFTKVLLLLIGRFVTLFATTFQSNNQFDNGIVVFPPIDRLDSIFPVLKEFEKQPTVLVPQPLWLQYIFRTEPGLSEFNPRSLYRYLTLHHLIEQVRDLFEVAHVLRSENQLEKDLVTGIDQEFDAHLPTVVPYLVTTTISDFRFIRALLVRRAIHSLASQSEFEKVVVGTLDPIGRAIIHGSIEREKQVFHIPHSIATTYPPNPPAETIQFTSGQLDKQYYEQVVPESLAWNWVPLGRPYLSDLYNRYSRGENSANQNLEPFELLIATQPGDEANRVELVSTVVNSLQSNFSNYYLIIKTHPDEDPELYQRFRSNYDNIEIETGNLFARVQSADLVVTINSNVGLESMVLGTPCVCYNPWYPRILDQTFAILGDVPVFRSKSEVREFFEKLDTKELNSLSSDQMEFVKENYRLAPTVSKDIADYICEC